MGYKPKALLRWRGKSFLELIADRGRRAGVDGVAVVLGYHLDQVEPTARELADVVAINETPELGMCSSARKLARAIPADTTMLLWPVDLPGIRRSTARAVLDRAEQVPAAMVIPVLGPEQKRGHPPSIPPAAVRGLRDVAPGQRLDQALEALCGTPQLITVDDPWILRDFDHPTDLGMIDEN